MSEEWAHEAWRTLTAALTAAAAAPQAAAAQRALREAYADLARQAADFELPGSQAPVGFAVDVYTQMQDVGMTRRALPLLDAEIARDPADAEALNERAMLQLGLSRYAAAAADFAAAAAAWQAQGDDDEADEARLQATNCAGGRAGLLKAWLSNIDQLAGELKDPARREVTMARFGALAPQVEAQAQEPDAAEMAAMAAQAERIAGQMGGALAFEPVQCIEHPHAAVKKELHPRLKEFDAQMKKLGIARLAWVENPALSAMFNQLALTGLWPQPTGDAMFLCSAAGMLHVAELETEFDDGRQLVTTRTRGRGFLDGGPRVDVMHVDGSLPLADWIALHRARVAYERALKPGLAVRPWRNVDEFVAGQERQRVAKMAHRLAVGIDEYEALAVPVDRPEHFVPLLRAAVQAFVQRQAEAFSRR